MGGNCFTDSLWKIKIVALNLGATYLVKILSFLPNKRYRNFEEKKIMEYLKMLKTAQMNINVNPLFRDACNEAAKMDGISLNEYVKKVMSQDLEKKGIRVSAEVSIKRDSKAYAEYKKTMMEYAEAARKGENPFDKPPTPQNTLAEYQKTMREYAEAARKGINPFIG